MENNETIFNDFINNLVVKQNPVEVQGIKVEGDRQYFRTTRDGKKVRLIREEAEIADMVILSVGNDMLEHAKKRLLALRNLEKEHGSPLPKEVADQWWSET